MPKNESLARLIENQRKESVQKALQVTRDPDTVSRMMVNRPVMIDINNPEGEKSLTAFKKNQAIRVDKQPGIAAAAEIRQFLLFYKDLLGQVDLSDFDAVRESLLDIMIVHLQKYSTDDIQNTLTRFLEVKNPILDDLARMIVTANGVGETEEKFEDSCCWIWYPADHLVRRFVCNQVHRLLMDLRLWSVIPLESVSHALGNLKICYLGSSNGIGILRQLVILGAKEIQFYIPDPGEPESSLNVYKRSGNSDSDEPLAIRLQNALFHLNPFGNFTGYFGESFHLKEFLAGADLIIEELAGVQKALQLRLMMHEEYPGMPLLSYLPGGLQASGWIEVPGRGGFFNEKSSVEDWKRYMQDMEFFSLQEMDLKSDPHFRNLLSGISQSQHLVNFLKTSGMLPGFLPAGIRSGSQKEFVTRLVLDYIRDGEDLVGERFTLSDLVKRQQTREDPVASVALDEIFTSRIMKAKSYSPDMKAKIVLELLRGEMSMEQASSEYHVSQEELFEWRVHFIEKASRAFEDAND